MAERLFVALGKRLEESLVSWAGSKQRLAIKKGVVGTGDSGGCQGLGSGGSGEICWSDMLVHISR